MRIFLSYISLLGIALTHQSFTLPLVLVFLVVHIVLSVLSKDRSEAIKLTIMGLVAAGTLSVFTGLPLLDIRLYNVHMSFLSCWVRNVNFLPFLPMFSDRFSANGYYDVVLMGLTPIGLACLISKERRVFVSLFTTLLVLGFAAVNICQAEILVGFDRISFFFFLPAVLLAGKVISILPSISNIAIGSRYLSLTYRTKILGWSILVISLVFSLYRNVEYVWSKQYIAPYGAIEVVVALLVLFILAQHAKFIRVTRE